MRIVEDKAMLMDDYYPLPASQREDHKPMPKLSEQAMPRPKRGQLKPMDQFEQDIIARATRFVVTMFTPFSSVRTYASHNTLQQAMDYVVEEVPKDPKVRCAMVYGVDEWDHHALACYYRQNDKEWKYPKLTYY